MTSARTGRIGISRVPGPHHLTPIGRAYASWRSLHVLRPQFWYAYDNTIVCSIISFSISGAPEIKQKEQENFQIMIGNYVAVTLSCSTIGPT